MEASDSSPHSKRHSYPVILTYTETLSVLSEHQREYNRKESIKRSKTPVLGQNDSDDERRQKLQEALDWLSQELVSIYSHRDRLERLRPVKPQGRRRRRRFNTRINAK